MSNAFTLTVDYANYVYDVTFEINLNGDGLTPLVFDQDAVAYHTCGDGHTHGFRINVDVDDGVGSMDFYAGLDGCSGSLVAGPLTTGLLPDRFAVRQAIQTPEGVFAASILGSRSGEPSPIGAQVRRYGITARKCH
jgi:hypothetical protein